MRLNVSPTRMELMGLRRRLAVAQRGYNMLKDKLDELIRQFLELVESVQGQREDIEKKIVRALDYFIMAKGATSEAVLEQVINYNEAEVRVAKRDKHILNLVVPELSVQSEGDVLSYGFADTTIALDASFSVLQEVLPEMVKLAELEKSIQIMAEEIEVTRRRVNALEYVLIPNIQETIHFIRMKLEERERSALTRLMKVKEIIQNR